MAVTGNLQVKQKYLETGIDDYLKKPYSINKWPWSSFQPTLEPGAMDRLINYYWPGNVRELENLVERVLILCNLALKKFYGKIHGPNGAVAILKINPSTLMNRMKKFRIRFEREK